MRYSGGHVIKFIEVCGFLQGELRQYMRLGLVKTSCAVRRDLKLAHFQGLFRVRDAPRRFSLS